MRRRSVVLPVVVVALGGVGSMSGGGGGGFGQLGFGNGYGLRLGTL